MNIPDENIEAGQRELLRRYKIPFRQIGVEIGRKGLDDVVQIIPLLLTLNNATLFTHDRLFARRKNAHAHDCLVYLEIHYTQSADGIRRFLKHPDFNMIKKRLGKVVRVGERIISTLD
jgi:hypothetical protein